MKRIMKTCDDSIRRLLNLAGEMIQLADEGDARRDDVGCGILFGIARDCAYKIRRLAQAELDEHQRLGRSIDYRLEPSGQEMRESEHKAQA